MLVVLVAEVDELLLEGVLKLLVGLDGLVLGRVRGREVDGLCGGLHVHLGELLAACHPAAQAVTCETYHFGF